MKYLYLTFILIYSLSTVKAQTVFINELHYDNVSQDENEGIEIAGPAGTDLSCFEIHLYNGSTGAVYESINALEGSLEDQSNGFGTFWLAIEGIQNGENDAIALYNSCVDSIVHFISYEGEMVASDGVAANLTSEDIGVAEVDTEAGTSLQLVGDGVMYTDFIWSEAMPSTNGAINTGQSFGEGNTEVSFSINPKELTVKENSDSTTIKLQATNLSGEYTVNINTNVSTADGPALLDEDFSLTQTTYMLNSSDGSNQVLDIVIQIINDEIEEEQERATFDIAIENMDGETTNLSFVLTIEDDDAILPVYTIEEIHTENENGIADSLGVTCELNGIVYGINLRDGGLSFTINDGTGGINIFNRNDNLGYEVNEGDEIKVQGSLGQFNGLTQIEANNISLISNDNDLGEPSAIVDSGLYEAVESEYIILQGLTLVDTAEWKGDGSGFNVNFLASTVVIDALINIVVRIDKSTSLASMSLEEVTGGITENYKNLTWNIKGIGGQYDTSEPYTEGYQLFPFSGDDIEVMLTTSVSSNEIHTDQLIVYPNPATSNWLNVNSIYPVERISLYTLNGALLKTTDASKMEVIDVNTGVYLLEIIVEGKKAYHKIIR